MATDQKMALLEEEMNKAPESSGFKPFFFMIKADEKALIRPLLNMNQYTLVHKHEFFNNATKQYEARAICAADLELECQHCLDAEQNKKLKAEVRFVLPVYVHAVVNTKTGQAVTYKNQDGEEVAVSGPRLLEMKRTSSILKDLVGAYNEDDEHNITGNDFVIRRTGEGLETEYTVTAKKPTPFTAEVAEQYRNPEQIIHLFTDACPPKLIGGDEKPVEPVTTIPPAKSATNGKVRSAPDF